MKEFVIARLKDGCWTRYSDTRNLTDTFDLLWYLRIKRGVCYSLLREIDTPLIDPIADGVLYDD